MFQAIPKKYYLRRRKFLYESFAVINAGEGRIQGPEEVPANAYNRQSTGPQGSKFL